MPKLYSSNQILKVLKRFKFRFVSQKGSHVKLRSQTKPPRTVIVPANRKQIPRGTFNSILRQSGLNSNDFE